MANKKSIRFFGDRELRAADALDAEGVQTLAKHYPNNRAHAFLGWFTYSDNSIDDRELFMKGIDYSYYY